MVINGGGSMSDSDDDEPVPEITAPDVKVRFYTNKVLVNICCEKGKGVISSIIDKIEDCHLSILNLSVIPVLGSLIHVDFSAQMEPEYDMSQEEFVSTVESLFQ